MNLCDDNRIITIEKAKQALIKGTNIEDSPEEMKVLDNILFRCWQMGWLDRYDPQKKQPITEEKIKAWLDRWEGYIDADMIARMKCRVIDIRNVHHSQAATDINVGHKAAGHGSNVPMQQTIPPMPSNTSNALEALNSVNTTQFNALDSISRQAAIRLESKNTVDLQETEGSDPSQIAAQIIHDAIDNTTFAEEAYPGIKEQLHRSVEEWEKLQPVFTEIAEEYKKSCEISYINKPLAHALYEVWKKHDRRDTKRNE